MRSESCNPPILTSSALNSVAIPDKCKERLLAALAISRAFLTVPLKCSKPPPYLSFSANLNNYCSIMSIYWVCIRSRNTSKVVLTNCSPRMHQRASDKNIIDNSPIILCIKNSNAFFGKEHILKDTNLSNFFPLEEKF